MTYAADATLRPVDDMRARNAFQRLHRRAALKSWLARLLRRETGLRSFEEARRDVGPHVTKERKLKEVRLDRVQGSFERTGDYTPEFLPRNADDEERWVRVRLAVEGDQGVPPLDLVEVGGTYYVRDGHHRVSVLRDLGVTRFESWVTHVEPVANPG